MIEALKPGFTKLFCEGRARVVSLGPGFPLRDKWEQLRDVSYVILLTKSPDRIYERMKERREKIFNRCPKAKEYDNRDIGVIVGEDRQEFPREVAVGKIKALLDGRPIYREHDAEILADDGDALEKLKELPLPAPFALKNVLGGACRSFSLEL
jgi:shikimate kinase